MITFGSWRIVKKHIKSQPNGEFVKSGGKEVWAALTPKDM